MCVCVFFVCMQYEFVFVRDGIYPISDEARFEKKVARFVDTSCILQSKKY